MSTIATPANTTAYRSLVSNQPTRGSWCDRCQPQPQPCMTYLWAYQAKASIPARVIRNTTVLIAMCMAGVTWWSRCWASRFPIRLDIAGEGLLLQCFFQLVRRAELPALAQRTLFQRQPQHLATVGLVTGGYLAFTIQQDPVIGIPHRGHQYAVRDHPRHMGNVGDIDCLARLQVALGLILDGGIHQLGGPMATRDQYDPHLVVQLQRLVELVRQRPGIKPFAYFHRMRGQRQAA